MDTVTMLDERVPVWRALPAGGSGPAVIVLQEIFGVSDYVKDRCRDLAAAGYVAYAPDLYARLDPVPAFDPATPDYVMQGVTAAGMLDWDEVAADVSALVTHVRQRPEVTGKVALLGFCWGGGLAFQVAAHTPPDALVAFYGSALPTLTHLSVAVPSLHHFGNADSYIPAAEVDRIEAALAGPHLEFHRYDGADHAFDNPHPLFHHAQASALAWQRTLDFLARTLR